MGDLAVALLGIVLVNQYALVRVPALRDEVGEPGLNPGASGALIIVLVASVALAWLIRAKLLQPLRLPELRFVVLVLATGAMTTLGAPLVGRVIPAVGRAVAAAPARLTFNAVALGAALLATRAPGSLAATVAWGVGTGGAFALLAACFAALRDRLDTGNVPRALQGGAIALVTAGIVCLGLGGLAGLVRG